mmetsp:Transcript_159681/g.387703  ORF Transcript_159681/g.387703 Transcript_159681/m.387703 type:complete len:138 (+) Transcript_159681:2-415(+)
MHGLMAEACDAGNMQFLGVCFRKNASDSEQRSRLAASILVKTPLAIVKTAAIATSWVALVEGTTVADELETVHHALGLAWVLSMYGIMQLLPTFFRMLCKRPLCYLVPLALLLFGLLLALLPGPLVVIFRVAAIMDC